MTGFKISVVFPCLFIGVYSNTILSKYVRLNTMDGQKCSADNTVFMSENIVSLMECMRECTNTTTCGAVAYEGFTQQCVGCHSDYSQSDSPELFGNSLFFERNKCPDSEGTIVINFDFKLKIYLTKVDPNTASSTCLEDVGGRLAVIDSESKINSVSTILQSCLGLTGANDYFWIDGQGTLDGWKFSSGDDVPTYLWSEGNPDPAGTTQCLSLKSQQKTLIHRYTGRPCDRNNAFICEY